MYYFFSVCLLLDHISCSVCSQKLVYIKAEEYEIIENFRLVGVINWRVLCNLHQ